MRNGAKRVFFRMVYAVRAMTGALLYAFGYVTLQLPAGIVPGGATGVASVLHQLFGIPAGTVILLCNLPLLFLAMRAFGVRGVLPMVSGIAVTSLLVNAFSFLPSLTGDRLVAAVLGGIVTGAGSGLLLRHGITTGGSDLAGVLLHRVIPRVSVGRFVLTIDAAVILLAALALRQFDGVFYSAASVFGYTLAMDAVQVGDNGAEGFFVVTSRPKEMAKAVMTELSRGVTVFHAQGAYTGEGREVLFSVVDRRERYALLRLVETLDPGAFLVAARLDAVRGNGFPDGKEKKRDF